MDKDRFPLGGAREPNPLRPYYIPPSIGPSNIAPNASSIPHAARGSIPKASSTASPISSAARDYLPEIDLDLKTTTSEAWQYTRTLFSTLAWRYTSVILAQPFDVSKTLMQVSNLQTYDATPQKRRPNPASRHGSARGRKGSHYSDYTETSESNDDDEDDDIPDYFSATAPRSRSPRKRRRTPPSEHLSLSPTPRPRNRREEDFDSGTKLRLKKPGSIMSTISALYNTSGAVGLWRASNATFLHAVLLRTTDSFLRSLLLTILGLPDLPGPDQGGLAPGLMASGAAGFSGIDLSESPNLMASLLVVGLSSCLTGLLLAPLDLVRMRLILTPMSYPPRGLVQNLRRLPSLVIPSTLWLPTALYHTLPNLFSAVAPTFLRRQLRITPDYPVWSLAAFTTSLSELFLRLPFETLLRRAQVHELHKTDSNLPLIVDMAPYAGISGTVYNIMYVEGETTTKAANGMLRKRRGQGVSGLVRGWRVGFWGLVGVWGAGLLGPGEARARGEF